MNRRPASPRESIPTMSMAAGIIAAGITMVACASDGSSDPLAESASSVTQEPTSPTTFVESDSAPISERSNPGSVGDPSNPITELEDGATFDPAWSAEVTLGCGPDDANRIVDSFVAETNERGDAELYLAHEGGRLDRLEVGDVVPADARFGWAIQGILLGPWIVDETDDTCA